jgi:hypothetical protein
MQLTLRQLRALIVAIAALALSATLVFAGSPAASHAPKAHGNAHATAGQSGDESSEPAESEEPDESEAPESEAPESEAPESDAPESPDANDSGDHCTTDPTNLTPEELAAMNHGSIVCWAAQQTSWPDQFRNHGAFVSWWAHQGKSHGHGHNQ